MPITVHADIRHVSQAEFSPIAYDVMREAFAIHNDLGRFFDEDIYRNALVSRLGNQAISEVQIDVRFEDFFKDYYIDLLVSAGAVFELKVVAKLGENHRAQLLNYLLMCELSHGKLINFRPTLIEHEFVNTSLKLCDRTAFEVTKKDWVEPISDSRPFAAWFEASLQDIGAGLDIGLYESLATHFFGGEKAVVRAIEINDCGQQKVHLASPDWAFKVTAINSDDMPIFEDHLQRFLRQTALQGFLWLNVTRKVVAFRALRRS